MSKKNRQQKASANSVSTGTEWDSDLKTAKFCGRCDLPKPAITLMPQVYERILRITAEVESQNVEWLGYLMGHIDEGGVYVISEIFVPKQEVSGGHVEVLEAYSNERLLGTGHLHPFNNGAWFSSTDDTFIGANHSVMIVHDKNLNFKGQARLALECGATIMTDAIVQLMTIPNPEMDKFLEDSLLNILTRPVPPVTSTLYTGARYCGACRRVMVPKELSRMVEGVEVCTPCFNADKKPTPTLYANPGKTCETCETYTPWADVFWVNGKWQCKNCGGVAISAQEYAQQFCDIP